MTTVMKLAYIGGRYHGARGTVSYSVAPSLPVPRRRSGTPGRSRSLEVARRYSIKALAMTKLDLPTEQVQPNLPVART